MKLIKDIHDLVEVHRKELSIRNIKRSVKLSEDLSLIKRHELNTIQFLAIQTPHDLCNFFGMSFLDLENQINNCNYKRFFIQKKKGGAREILEPDLQLKDIQRYLNHYLQAYYLSIKPKEIHGFIIHPKYLESYNNIVSNANVHIQKKHLLNIDLKNFFPSISANRIKRLFISPLFNFNNSVANALTLLTSYQAKLPIGAPTSPVISNFICLEFDSEIIKYCLDKNISFSRYADDLTFSSNFKFDDEQISDIYFIIRKHNFEVNDKKVHLTASNRSQKVTGLTVNNKVNIERKLLKKIRAMQHDALTNGVEAATGKHFNLRQRATYSQQLKYVNKLIGYFNFVCQVRGKTDLLYLKLVEKAKPFLFDQKTMLKMFISWDKKNN